jgi:outer membrane protein OmpA-like peptidoglycan-associated protein
VTTKIVVLLACICLSIPGQSQTPALIKKQGEKYFDKSQWKEAAEQFSQYQTTQPNDPEVLTKLGICYYHLRQSDQAQKYLEFVKSRNPASKDLDMLYFLARTLHGRGEYEKAIPAYKAFISAAPADHPSRLFCVDNILRCATGLHISENDNVALVENMGNSINSEGDEVAPIPSVNHRDRLYYSAARPGCTGGQRNDKGYEDTDNGYWRHDMFIARQTNSGWENIGNFGGLLNTARSEMTLDFSKDGRILYFLRGFTLFSGEMLVDTSGRKDEYSSTPPVFEGPIQMEEGDAGPFLFKDSILLFASRRTGGFGGLDLYYAIRQSGVWSTPQNLGAVVNSAYDETTPFLAADGRTLYFSSNHRHTIGGMDVFKVQYDPEKRTWSAPQNLGIPVNSPNDDTHFRLSADGNTAFLASDRLEGYGRRDLYTIYFKEQQAEQSAPSAIAWFQAEVPAATSGATTAQIVAPERTLLLPTLSYNTDRDVLSPENEAILEAVARAARSNPSYIVQISVHTDETSASKFDLYSGIKRAEIVGKALTEKGLPATRILLKSGGSLYPLARSFRGASPDPEGKKLNRRVEIRVSDMYGNLPAVLPVRPEVPQETVLDGGKRYDVQFNGLTYRVEAVVARQLLNNDALGMFEDIGIESQQGTGAYRYMVGFSQKYADAAKLCKELQNIGFNSAVVVPYIYGLRFGKAEAVSFLKKYPDLAGYIRG